MNEVVTQNSASRQDVPLARGGPESRHEATGVSPVALEKLIHDLRQPLGTVDSLAYFLELTVADEQASPHLRKIRAMVWRASQILESAAAIRASSLLEHSANENQDFVCC
jgi:hypothetical protein